MSPIHFRSNIYRTIKTHEEIARAALIEGAKPIEREAIKIARRGFDGGAWVTDGWRSIGSRIVRVRTRLRVEVGSSLVHFAAWEVGHYNIFLRRFVRREWLRPAMQSTREEQKREAANAAKRIARRHRKLPRLVGRR